MNQEIEEIGKEVIKSLPEYVMEIITGFSSVAEKLRIGSDDDAMILFNKSVGSLGDLWELVTTLISLGIIEDSEQIESITSKMSAFISQLVEAKEENDYVLLADIMEYETEDAISGVLNIKLSDSVKDDDRG